MNLKYFPLDSQLCPVEIESCTYIVCYSAPAPSHNYVGNEMRFSVTNIVGKANPDEKKCDDLGLISHR